MNQANMQMSRELTMDELDAVSGGGGKGDGSGGGHGSGTGGGTGGGGGNGSGGGDGLGWLRHLIDVIFH